MHGVTESTSFNRLGNRADYGILRLIFQVDELLTDNLFVLKFDGAFDDL
ncbi:Uncharacterised protein [Salmonella enterica subsp. enterica serovar Bovismorbificans]|uniref:Uncharacterized protein n=1 Tax=Salmonella enterica subsp. enterica serovar Bovismorbificans TaxID=58097 RepID=A0A655BP71_SALET|nr:Uncharacterised protein [Salmonella enterica subsp. enterica serovar Bovismorbificans]